MAYQNSSGDCRLFSAAALAVAGTILGAASHSRAASCSWDEVQSAGDWNLAGNWSPIAVPTDGDDVFLTDTGANDISVNYVDPDPGNPHTLNTVTIDALDAGLFTLLQSQGYLSVGTLAAGLSTGGRGEYVLSGGSISAGAALIGVNGVGTVTHNGGLFQATSVLSLGDSISGRGRYNMSNSAVLLATEIDVGYQGSGIFSQTASSVTASSFISVGSFSGARGTYNMISNATLSTPRLLVGHAGTGTFSQAGGVLNVATFLSVGELPGAVGTFAIGVGATMTTPELDIGFQGTGNFIQNGGTVNAPNLNLAARAGSVGSYTLNAGTINATDLIVAIEPGTTAMYIQSGGVANFGGDLSIGYDSAANNVAAQGTFRLDGGIVNANRAQVGGLPGASGGFGTLLVNGGAFNVADTMVMFARGVGTYSGGSMNVGTLDMRQSSSLLVGAGAQRVLRVKNLSMTSAPNPQARIDLNDNDMIVDYTGGSPYATVRNFIKYAYNNGAWSRTGIGTSLGNVSVVGLGYAEASDALGISGAGTGSFSGQSVDATSVLIKFTWYGDANIDGKVDIVDLGMLASHWQQSGDWIAGDFNYDGTVNIVDLGLLAGNWQSGVGSPLAVPLGEALASLGLPSAQVPEPTTLILAIGSIAGWQFSNKRRRLH